MAKQLGSSYNVIVSVRAEGVSVSTEGTVYDPSGTCPLDREAKQVRSSISYDGDQTVAALRAAAEAALKVEGGVS